MNKPLLFLAGALVGGGIGYFVGTVVTEVIYMREHLDELDDPYGGPMEDDLSDEEFGTKEPRILMGHKPNSPKAGKVVNYTEHFIRSGKPELAALVAKYNNGIVPEEPNADLVEEIEYSQEDPDMPTDPSIISVIEYANSDGYTAITLKYYSDDVVTDEHDNPIERPEDILGEDALVSFGELSGDEDVVYVRNEAKRALYEVVRTNSEYADSRPVRRTSRRVNNNKEDNDAKEDNT